MTKETTTFSRREFLTVSAAAGAGLLISIYLSGCESEATPTSSSVAVPDSPPPTTEPTAPPATEPAVQVAATATTVPEPTAWFEPNLYVQIDDIGQVTITASRTEMGQGVRTALAMILAEELEADWSSVQVKTAPADVRLGRQLTGGSQSIEQLFRPMRQAGALAREMLLAAAAQIWEVAPEECAAENGAVFHPESGRQLNYGELVTTAATLPVPSSSSIPLKDPKEFRLIGTSLGQIDESHFVDGSATYGMDVRLPDMRFAVITRPPVISGRLESFDATKALATTGVQDVLELDSGVAVVGDSTWAAMQGRQALQISWDDGRLGEASSEETRLRLVEAAQNDLSAVDDEHLTAVYEMPFLAHATMEPLNCTADVRADSCTVWVPTQNPQDAKSRAMAITGLPRDAVTVNVTMIGGGFGRRLEVDYVDEAVALSQALGTPVQVVWTREDDMRHDYYHPMTVIGCREQPGQSDPVFMRTNPSHSIVHTGNLRAVTNIPEAFGHECFMDELAAARGRDPYEFRRELLPERERTVLDLAAEKAGWGTPMPESMGRGISFHSTWGLTHVAQVAEVSVAGDGTVSVDRVVCAIDCGIVVNPAMVVAQMEGGIVFGLSALRGEIVVENGHVLQSNFHDYPIMRLNEIPQIEVYIVSSEERPVGVGEMGTPPVIPAVVNAIFAATGRRIRRLPLLSAT